MSREPRAAIRCSRRLLFRGLLAELGFNITTILAGSSIVAVTIAFGLQNVLKDLVSGVFILVEDQLDDAGGAASP